MKRYYLLLILAFNISLAFAQVSTLPVFITQSGMSIDITFDAAAGSAGLKGLTSGVYAHMGVITSASTSSSDWKYVVTPWPNGTNSAQANIAKNTLTYIGNNIWKMSISPDILSFFGVPSNQTVTKLAFVFRNADGSKTGKTATGGDIIVNVYQSGLNMSFQKPASNLTLAVGSTQVFKIAASVNSQLKIEVNGSVIKSSTTDSTTLTATHTFSAAGDYTVIGTAVASGAVVFDTVYVFVPQPVISQARPAGVKEGINYVDNSTVTLVLHAPDKSNVFLLGDVNNWMQLNAYQLKKDGEYWWITLSGLTPGQLYRYQYLVDGAIKISDPYTELLLDPWNDPYINQNYTIYPDLPAYPTGKTDGVVATFQTNRSAYSWEVNSFTPASYENMVIYELLLRDFTTEKSYAAAIAKLDYLKNLGITAIELMPVQEFDGNNSWGYNPNHFFAVDKAYGPADMLRKFIDECHKRNIAVILDMVFNHASGLSAFAGLFWDSTNNRPAANNPWMNAVAPHPYSVYNDFNHSYTATREHFKRVLQFWLTEYKVDGYRMDLTKGLTQTTSTESTASNYDQSRIDILTEYYNAAKAVKPDVMFILEHFCSSTEETALANKGMYLWRNVNNAYSQAAMGYQTSSEFSGMVASPRQWVGYAESHDEERNFFKAKTYGASFIATDSIARIKRVPLNIAFTTLLPGPKMVWQFGEMGYDYSINSNGGRTNEKPSAWGWLNLSHRKAAADAAAKIISLRKLYPSAFTQGTFSTQVTAADWSAARRIALAHSDLNMVVLGNFTTAAVTAYPNFSKTGKWYNVLTGEELNVTNTAMSVTMQTGDLLIYTDRVVNFPSGVENTAVRNESIVFPTVTSGRLYVNTPNSVNKVAVYTLHGQLLRTENNISQTDLSALSSGVYLVEISMPGRRVVAKVMKE